MAGRITGNLFGNLPSSVATIVMLGLAVWLIPQLLNWAIFKAVVVAKPGATVEVHYVGVEYDTGDEFDSSWNRGESISFPLRGLIQGWQDGIPGMRVGGRRQLTIPPEQAYGPAEVRLLARALPSDDEQPVDAAVLSLEEAPAVHALAQSAVADAAFDPRAEVEALDARGMRELVPGIEVELPQESPALPLDPLAFAPPRAPEPALPAPAYSFDTRSSSLLNNVTTAGSYAAANLSCTGLTAARMRACSAAAISLWTMPLAFSSSAFSTKPGRWRAEQVGVKAPGTEKSATLRPAK